MPNATSLVVAIPGSCSLKDIRNVIRFHEAYLWKLKGIAVDGRLNVVSLEASDGVPGDLDIVTGDGPIFAGATRIWKGKLRYNGAEDEVAIYRLPP